MRRTVPEVTRLTGVLSVHEIRKGYTMKLPNAATRQWLYGIVVAALPLLVVLKIVNPGDVPLWLALAGAVLGTGAAGTAFVALKQQRKTGEVEPSKSE